MKKIFAMLLCLLVLVSSIAAIGPISDVLEEGESKTIYANSVDYNVYINDIDEGTKEVLDPGYEVTKLKINDELTSQLEENDNYTIATGQILQIVDLQDNAVGTLDTVDLCLSEGADEVCAHMEQGETKTLTLNSAQFEVEATIIFTVGQIYNVTSPETVTMTVNGESTGALEKDDNFTLTDGSLVAVDFIGIQNAPEVHEVEFTITPVNMLMIDSVDVKVDPDTELNVEPGVLIARTALPGSEVDFSVGVSNLYTDGTDITNVQATVEIVGVDTETVNMNSFIEGQEKTAEFEFVLPSSLADNVYEVKIAISGEGPTDTFHSAEWIMYLDVKDQGIDFSTIKEALDTFACSGQEVEFVIGENAPATDEVSAMDIRSSLKNYEICEGANVARISVDSDMSSTTNKNIVAIGHPNDNSIVEEYVGDGNYWPLSYGSAVIKVYNNGGNAVIVIAGSNAEDTRIAARALAAYTQHNFDYSTVKVEGNDLNDITVSHENNFFNVAPRFKEDDFFPQGAPSPVFPKEVNEGETFDCSIYAYDPDGDSITTQWFVDNVEVHSETASGSINTQYTYAPADGDIGLHKIKVVVNDGVAMDIYTRQVSVLDVNVAPVIDSFSPTNNELRIKSDGSVDFSISVSDADTETLKYRWYNGDVVISGEHANAYSYSASTEGTFAIKVEVTDGVSVTSQEWSIVVSDRPFVTSFDGSTTDFSNIDDLTSVENVVLEKSNYGKIEFTSSLDLSNAPDFDGCVYIGNDVVAVDTNCLPELAGKSARITMYDNSYNSVPIIYYNSGYTTSSSAVTDINTISTLVSYDSFPTSNGNVVFDVDHFSTFRIGEEGAKIIIKSIEVEVDGDRESGADENGGTINNDVFPGSVITVEVELENLFDTIDFTDVEVDGTLYDIDDNDDIEEEESLDELDAGDDDTVTLTFRIPMKVEAGDYRLLIEVDAEDENDDNHYAEVEFTVEVEKESHAIVIDDAELDNDFLSCTRSTSLEVEIFNIGEDKEKDVVIEVENQDLGINMEVDGIELDEDPDDDDNNARKTFYIDVADDVAPGTYPIIVKVYDEDGDLMDSETVDLTIRSCGSVSNEEVIGNVVINDEIRPITNSPKESFRDSFEYTVLLIIAAVLLLGAFTYAVGALVITSKRKY